MYKWHQKTVAQEEKQAFYDWIAKDKEIVKVILLLTGSIQGTKNKFAKYLEGFNRFKEYWEKDVYK